MIYTRPDYYKEFQCIADQCPDTCCAGWQIMIDGESLEKYRKLKGDYIWKVMSCVDWESGTFRQDKAKRCAFLNERNLCNLYTNAGEDALCKTCREYPRHTEEFEGVREITLSVSCPVVAKMLMERTETVSFVTEETVEKETEDFDEFDPFLFSILEDARQQMIEILQDRTLPLRNRVVLLLGMAHDMQGRINRSEMFDCFSVIEKYAGEKALVYVENYLRKRQQMCNRGDGVLGNEAFAKEMFDQLYKLEVLREDWKETLHRTWDILFCNPKDRFENLYAKFQLWKQNDPQAEIQLEQILVYFLFTYFPGAVYDGAVFAKTQMSVYCTWMVELLWMAEWITGGGQLETEKRTSLLYRFSREVEHSDENLKRMDRMMAKKWLLK